MTKTQKILTELKGRYLTIDRGNRYITIEQIVKIVQQETRAALLKKLEKQKKNDKCCYLHDDPYCKRDLCCDKCPFNKTE